MKIKTATFNIANGREVAHDFSVLARDIVASGAEIVALQEVDHFTTRNGNQDTMKILSEETGMPYYVYAPTLKSYKGGQYGIAFLSQYPILSHEIVDLPMLSDAEEPRVVLHVSIDVNGYMLEFFNTHGQQVSICEQLSKINEYTSKHAEFVLAGDFNTAKYERFGLIENSYTVNNYDNPMITTIHDHSFDNYAIANSIGAENVHLINTAHSDHLMLRVDLIVPDKK